ncbi:HlyD family efflux transporter periplasmic adaptor subunit, partial [Vibrio parahaemolyticus]|nr:HlyD family efflux transporter periplasmic adaptor subunit [Vibrio parahaemolyticus]
VVRLAHDGPRAVWFSVPEDKVELVRRLRSDNVPLEVRLWSDRERALQARVEEVAAAADPATRTYLVKANLGRTDLPLGQTASVRIAVP